jgi:tRNA (guanine9-N1)-methyltransferase
LLFTSLNGRTFERLEGTGDASFKRWTRVEWWKSGYEGLWDESSSPDVLETETVTKSGRSPQRAPKDKVVYLTADCDEELEELKEDETYIIGGVVDRNRYKVYALLSSKHQTLT